MPTKKSITRHARSLLLDIGNTNLKWAWLENGVLGEISRIPHAGQSIDGLIGRQWHREPRPDRVFIANVAGPALQQELTTWIQASWSINPIIVKPQKRAYGVCNAYTEPGKLGVDRWLTLIAVYRKNPCPACIVDCGTAVTIDVLGVGGEHLGGVIIPGLGLMQQALLKHTAIPYRADVEPSGFLATSTEEAIAAGGVNAVAALVERVKCEAEEKIGLSIKLVLTGSDAPRLQRSLRLSAGIESDLVMQGLIIIAESSSTVSLEY